MTEVTQPSNDEGAEKSALFSMRYRVLALFILQLAVISSIIDRQVIIILQEPIKADLGISDTQLGLLTGAAFGLFYAFMGIPIAMLADRMNRRNVIAVSIAMWSLMTAACGLAQSYMQLFLVRTGVAIGEAGGGPPSHSIVSDLFPPHQRATALSITSAGANLGVLGGFVIGGLLFELVGWRQVFFYVAAPGLLVALMIRFLLREPPRGMSEARTETDQAAPPFLEVLKFVWSQKSLVHLLCGSALATVVGFGFNSWSPSFFIRTHEMSVAEVGVAAGVIFGIFGAIGTLTAGRLSDYLGRRDLRWRIWILAVIYVVAVPLMIATVMAPTKNSALIIYALVSLTTGAFMAPTWAVTQSLVGLRMRAVASALALFMTNFFGMTFGPLIVGVISDMFAPTMGNDSLRLGIVVLSFFYLWGVVHYYLAGKTLVADLKRASQK